MLKVFVDRKEERIEGTWAVKCHWKVMEVGKDFKDTCYMIIFLIHSALISLMELVQDSWMKITFIVVK